MSHLQEVRRQVWAANEKQAIEDVQFELAMRSRRREEEKKARERRERMEEGRD